MGKYSTIMITGGAGFIGSNFIRNIIDRDYEIINYDKLTYAGNLSNLKDIEGRKNYRFIKADICDPIMVKKAVNTYKPDVIINFAAETHVDRSIIGSTDFIVTNINGTRVLLDAAMEFQVKRFIQISTDEVYGDLSDLNIRKFTVNTPLKPSSPYSATKASADMLALSYRRTYDMPVIITRCSNNYGPYQFPEKLIPLVIYKALRNESIPVYGDGKHIRDWIYVDDHNEAVLQVMENGIDGHVYNIGANNEMNNIELIEYILGIMNRDESLMEFIADRRGHDRHYAVDIEEIKEAIGFSASMSFDRGIRQTIEWYMNNLQWMEQCMSGEYMAYYEKNYSLKDK